MTAAEWDAIVVGAGPAGSTAAFRLARAGARTLLLDRARFPRDKPCAGGVSVRALRELPFGIDPVVEEVVHGVEVRVGRRGRPGRIARTSREPLVLLTQRLRLDRHLVEQAVAAGAVLREGARAAAVREGAVELADGEVVTARVVVGADGANGVAPRAVGADVLHQVALEGNVPYGGVVERARYAGRLALEFGRVPGGYGWAFPKADHVNFGVLGWLEEGPALRAHLGELCARHGVDADALRALRGHRLPLRRPGSPVGRGRIALVGDAAGLADPLSGDGMFEAFLSAQLASEHALEVLAGRADGFDGYAAALDARLGPLLRASWAIKLAADRYPRASFAVVRAPLVWGVVCRVLRGDVAAPQEARGPVRVPLYVLKRIARLASASLATPLPWSVRSVTLGVSDPRS